MCLATRLPNDGGYFLLATGEADGDLFVPFLGMGDGDFMYYFLL